MERTYLYNQLNYYSHSLPNYAQLNINQITFIKSSNQSSKHISNLPKQLVPGLLNREGNNPRYTGHNTLNYSLLNFNVQSVFEPIHEVNIFVFIYKVTCKHKHWYHQILREIYQTNCLFVYPQSQGVLVNVGQFSDVNVFSR